MRVILCNLAQADGVVSRWRPSHLVSLLSPEDEPLFPVAPDGVRHLKVPVHDIEAPSEPHHVPPAEEHLRTILAFAETWSAEAPMVVHCWAGISRSTASILTIAARRNPAVDDARLVERLAKVAPWARPNRRLVALADAALDRGGRLVAAVEAQHARASDQPTEPVWIPAVFDTDDVRA